MTKLKAKRMEVGLTQSQLAEKADINVRVLQHYEQGSKNFDHARIDTILKVCLALECKMSDVIANEDYLNLIESYEKSHS